jgi:YD repeat-containing protein
MATPSPEAIRELTEKMSAAVTWLAEVLQGRDWLTKLVLIDVVIFLFFNPDVYPLIPTLYQSLRGRPLPTLYPLGFWTIFGSIAIAAFVVALRTKRGESHVPGPDPAARSAIKGLRPFGFEDASLFARLQRGALVRECLEVLTDPEFRFGILYGTSGCGKTSFLRAGLWPRLSAPDASHCGVYVQCRELNPLESIRRALADQLHLPPASIECAEWLPLLATAAQAASKPLVVLLDQFEQFFVHHKRKKDREPFVHALVAWYRQEPPLPVKLLVCIRGDMTERLLELQKAMAYTLSPQHHFALEPLELREAVEIFRVIAETEQLTFDRSFVEEMVAQELANREDGLVSPVDVQILAWMVKGQKMPEERGFTRTAYQKLGGIEGLLDQFLARALDVRETSARREAALKVLLALTDLESNARAGVLTLDQLREKLAGTVAAGDLHEAVTWLARSDVRLITPISRNGAQGYELAHERLIPALRRIAGKELSQADQANLLLERRVNEWLGNNRAARSLLTRRELRTIERQKPYVVWGVKRREKEALLSRSKRRWHARLGTALLFVLLIGGSMVWYWDAYHRTSVEHYANVITRWGLPEGVGRLSDAQVRRRNTTLAFSKRGRRGPVHDVRLVNSRGVSPPLFARTAVFPWGDLNPLEQDTTLPEDMLMCRVTIERDADGRILDQRAFNCADRELFRLHYAQPGWAEYKEGPINIQRRESGITHIQFVWPESGPEAGLTKEVLFFDRDGNPQPDRDGTYGYGFQRVFDPQGSVEERLRLGADRQPTVNSMGIARQVLTYDALGNVTRIVNLGRDRQPVVNASGVAEEKVVYDYYGNTTEVTFLGTEGQLVTLKSLGAAGRQFRYDEHGNLVEAAFFGPNRQLVSGRLRLFKGRLEFARNTIGWDAEGRSRETYFGPDGKPILVFGRVAQVRNVRDDRGYIVETAYFDEHGRPTRDYEGCAKLRMAYDEQGNLAESTCLDETDHAVRTTQGWAKATLRHDKRGNVTEKSYFGPDGRPSLYEQRYVKVQITYNAQGKRIEEVYFDANDRPVRTNDGYAKITFRYDLQGQLIEAAFFDEHGGLTSRIGGYAQQRRTYDARGNLIEETFFDPQGNPVRHDDEYVKARFAYDERGYRIETALFDEHDRPTLHREGYAIQRVTYDDSGRMLEAAHYGLDGSPVLLTKTVFTKKKWTYDARGKVVQIVFFDPDDRLVQTVEGYAMIRAAYDDLGRETSREFLDVNGAPVHTWVAIRAFEPGSNGQRLGFQVGDLLLSYDGEDVGNTHMFSELELVRGEGRRELRIQRQGQVVTIDVPPGRLQGLDLVDRVPSASIKAGL